MFVNLYIYIKAIVIYNKFKAMRIGAGNPYCIVKKISRFFSVKVGGKYKYG